MNAHLADDVNMLHEDLPQYDEQQQDENEDVVDEQEEEDDDDDDDDEVEQDEDDEDEEDDRLFRLACGNIELNQSDLTDIDCSSILLNNYRAYLLGRALLRNTHLKTLDVTFMERAAGRFTFLGARYFIGGFLGSQIKSLTLRGSEELPLEMSQLSLQSIEQISLRFPMRDVFAIKLCESLTVSKLLTHLTIPIDLMTACAAQALSTFLCSSSITTLGLFVESGRTAAKSTVQRIYLDGVQHCQSIQSLTVFSFVGDMHALATAIRRLSEFCLATVHLSLSEVELLTHGLSDSHQLHTLSLLACKLNNEHMRLLSPVLGAHPSIKSLTLNYNEIGDEGVATFVEHWKPSSIIKKLSLQENNIDSKGAELLIKALSSRTTLWLLELSGNVIGFDGVELIGEALPDAKVKTLNLPYWVDWIDDEDVTCDAAVIQEAKRMAAYRTLLEGVWGNVHLLRLSYNYSDVLPHFQDEIDVYLKANACGRGKALELQHMLPAAIWCHFFARSCMTCSLTFLFLRELPILMMGRGSNNNNSNNAGRKRRRDD